MTDIPLYNMKGDDVGRLDLPEDVFGVEPNVSLMHQAVATEEANRRQGTADTKTRAEIRGGGKKPWRQKGTGRARQGSTRAPHWRHGGVVFGPHPRSYTKAFPKQMRRGALRSALSSRVLDGGIIGIDALKLDGDQPSTRAAVTVLNALPLAREVRTKRFENEERVIGTRTVSHKVLLIVPEHDAILLKSIRNIPYVTLRHAPNFSVRDVLAAGRVVLVKAAIVSIQATLSGTSKSAEAAAS